MLSMNEKYNLVLHKLNGVKGECIDASKFNLEYNEFESIINQLENDGLINKGEWNLSGNYYSQGLTFDGRNFIENNDSKEYHKIEKTEIYNNLHIEKNHSIAVAGDHTIINNPEFSQKFTQLIQEIQSSNIGDKDKIIQELNSKKDDKEALQTYLGKLLTRGSEVASITSAIGVLLGVV